MRVRKLSTAALLCGVVAMSTSACLQNPQGGAGGEGGGLSGTVDGGTADGDKTVTILGAFGGDEEKFFVQSLQKFQQETGIKIQYTADQDCSTTPAS